MDLHELIAELGAATGGVLSRRQLIQAGAVPAEVDDLRRRKALTLIRRGWYVTPWADPVVVAAVKAGAVVACVSALSHHAGVWIPPGERRLHVRWSEHRRRPTKFEKQCRAHRTLATPTRAVDNLPDALRCAANCLAPDMMVAVLESTLRRPEPYTIADLHDCFDGAPKRVTGLLHRLEPLAESGTESVVRFRLQSEGMKVRSQVVIPGVGRVDLLAGDRLIIECDSDGHHNGDQRKRDCRRDRTSTVGNYRVLRIDYDEVMDEQMWAAFLEEVRSLIRKGRHRGSTDF